MRGVTPLFSGWRPRPREYTPLMLPLVQYYYFVTPGQNRGVYTRVFVRYGGVILPRFIWYSSTCINPLIDPEGAIRILLLPRGSKKLVLLPRGSNKRILLPWEQHNINHNSRLKAIYGGFAIIILLTTQ